MHCARRVKGVKTQRRSGARARPATRPQPRAYPSIASWSPRSHAASCWEAASTRHSTAHTGPLARPAGPSGPRGRGHTRQQMRAVTWSPRVYLHRDDSAIRGHRPAPTAALQGSPGRRCSAFQSARAAARRRPGRRSGGEARHEDA